MHLQVIRKATPRPYGEALARPARGPESIYETNLRNSIN